MKELDSRLKAILAEIDCEALADIGCDHGYIGVSALKSGRAKRLIASDISEKSLSKCRRLAASEGLGEKVKFVVSDGFENIRDKVDTAVIAGLGGYEIIKILERAKRLNRVPEKLILCPHQNASELRRYLSGTPVERDYVVRSDLKFYPVIVISGKGERYLETEFGYGKNLPPSTDFTEMLFRRLNVLDERFRERTMPEKVKTEYDEIKELLCRK